MTKLEEIAQAISHSLSERLTEEPTDRDYYLAAREAVEAMRAIRSSSEARALEAAIDQILNEKP